jgi:hypothetical protein
MTTETQECRRVIDSHNDDAVNCYRRGNGA